MHKSLDEFEFQPVTTELAALERRKNQCIMLWPLKRLRF